MSCVIENRLDVYEPETERPARDEKCLRSRYPLDPDFGRHTAPRERPWAARPVCRDGKDARRAAQQRLIGAIEQRTRACGIDGSRIEERRLTRNGRGNV